MRNTAPLGTALLGILTVGLVGCAVEPPRPVDDLAGDRGPVETLPLERVRLLDGPFRDAQDRNLEYVLAMDPDRLLAPFLVEAGLEPGAANYGNWEGSGLNGHIGGHYLTALSLAWAATGRQDVLELPMAPHVERLPDGSDYVALLYGPIVLSAETTPFENEELDVYADDSRMGHVPSGATCPLESAPILVSGSSADLAETIERVDDDELRFRFSGGIEPESYADVELIPFFRVRHSRYMLYWPHSTLPETEEEP